MGVATNWNRIADAIAFYQAKGFEYVEAPWIVPTNVLMATCPDERYVINSTIGGLVGSAEQSFIHLRESEGLESGKYVACTPCFRNEDKVDALHQRTFMKVELYASSSFEDGEIHNVVAIAREFFQRIIPVDLLPDLKTVQTGNLTFDIELSGIEIGSYGFRSHNGIDWVYGTGLAEPRFETALDYTIKCR